MQAVARRAGAQPPSATASTATPATINGASEKQIRQITASGFRDGAGNRLEVRRRDFRDWRES